MKKKLEIVQKENEPEVPVKIIAQSIRDIAQAAKALKNSGLNERALVVLLKDATGVSMSDISLVLTGLEQLEKLYTNKQK